jgi:hypothetical protein
MLVHGSPKPVLPARDIDRHLIKVPFIPSYRRTPADLIGKALAEFQGPLPDLQPRLTLG